jgi:ribbon-helix-helix CopG family protein
MRTTVRLPPGLMTQVKKLARETGRTMTQVIEDALRAAVARSHAAVGPRVVTIVTATGDGLQPGVDLDDTSALLDRMDGIE